MAVTVASLQGKTQEELVLMMNELCYRFNVLRDGIRNGTIPDDQAAQNLRDDYKLSRRRIAIAWGKTQIDPGDS